MYHLSFQCCNIYGMLGSNYTLVYMAGGSLSRRVGPDGEWEWVRVSGAKESFFKDGKMMGLHECVDIRVEVHE